MPRLQYLVDGGVLDDHIDLASNQDVVEFLERTQPSCHSDNAAILVEVAAEKCGEWIGFSPSFENYRYIALITNRNVFALGMGMDSLYFKVPDSLHATAMAAGALPAEQIGRNWIEIKLFRTDWPAPDVPFWTLKSYAAARGNYR
jgi:hypothetical protein